MARITDPNAPGYWNQPEFEGDIPRFLSNIPFLGLLAEPFRNRPATSTWTGSPAGEGPYTQGAYSTNTGGVLTGPDWMPHPDDAERYWQSPQGRLRIALEGARSEIGDEAVARIAEQIRQGATEEDIISSIRGEVEYARGEKIWQQQQEEIQRLKETLPKLYDEEIAREQEQSARFTGMLENPSSIRSDKEYGQMLANAEGAINSQLLQEQRNISQATNARGLSRSGKGDELAGRLATGAAEQRAGILTDTLADVYGRGEASKNRLFGLKLAREDTQTDNIDRLRSSANFLNTLNRTPAYPYGTVLDARLGNYGRRDIDDAKVFQYVSLGASLADNASQRMTDMIGGFMPGGK